MDLKDSLLVFKAIEFMSYGIDISQFSTDSEFKGYVNKATKKYIARLSSNVEDYIIKVDEQLQQVLSFIHPYIVRHQKTFYLVNPEDDTQELLKDRSENIVVTYDMFIHTMQQLYKQNISSFQGVSRTLLDPELKERLDNLEKSIDKTKAPNNAFTQALSKDKIKSNFNILTAVAYQNAPSIKEQMIKTFNSKWTSFGINSLKDFEIVDDRIYIPITEADQYRLKEYFIEHNMTEDPQLSSVKYIVVSKNLYDYYFCSTGSEFQSCFSLSSSHSGWYGMLPFGTFQGHYMVYATKDEPAKMSLLNCNKKWDIPHMFFRCWGWLDAHNRLLLDKVYTSRRTMFHAIRDTILNKYMVVNCSDSYTDVAQGKEMISFFIEHNLKFYPDSIKFSEQGFKFRLDAGEKSFRGRYSLPYVNGLLSELKKIVQVSETFNPEKDMLITLEGCLINPKKCPITGIDIDETESQSHYAKYLNNPIQGRMAVVTYCDGFFKLDSKNCQDFETQASLKCFSRRRDGSGYDNDVVIFDPEFSDLFCPLKTFKERLKGGIELSGYDLILLRVVDKDKVNYIKYKKSGVSA